MGRFGGFYKGEKKKQKKGKEGQSGPAAPSASPFRLPEIIGRRSKP